MTDPYNTPPQMLPWGYISAVLAAILALFLIASLLYVALYIPLSSPPPIPESEPIELESIDTTPITDGKQINIIHMDNPLWDGNNLTKDDPFSTDFEEAEGYVNEIEVK